MSQSKPSGARPPATLAFIAQTKKLERSSSGSVSADYVLKAKISRNQNGATLSAKAGAFRVNTIGARIPEG